MKKMQLNQLKTVMALCGLIMLSFNGIAQIEPIQVGTTTRQMLVYAPSGIEPGRPLVLSLHGLNQDIAYQKNQAKWETVAKENNFVVVYPAGLNNSWDISGTQDTDFILAIIDEMYERYGIDRKRVYLSGFSMGGMMTYHAARVIADKIAAFAPVSGYLMSGPDTNSSRPIPIIHTHGTSDDVVPFDGVQTCLDAWIARNGCPTTPEHLDPYPPEKTGSNGERFTWGPGIDNVSVVLIKLNGPGHYHSIDQSGVNTTQEIWDFCKNYALGFGVPEFEFAYVGESNPKQILLTLSESIEPADTSYKGFTVKVDELEVVIDSVVLADTNILAICLQDSILKENDITLSYTDGNVISVYEKILENFGDTLVENLLIGAAPRLVELYTNQNGDTLLGKFNMKMQVPSDVSALTFQGEYNGDTLFTISGSAYGDDSTLLAFPLEEKLYADFSLFLSYSGDNIASVDTGLLKTFTDFPVTNNAIGLPVQLQSAELADDSYTLVLKFPKPMLLNDDQLDQFNLQQNGQDADFKEYSLSGDGIRFILADNMHYGDVATISYTPGDIIAADGGALEGFTSVTVENLIAAPTWQQIPGKIEAEDYTFQFGTSTETTSDAGGGLNVGWIETGDWLEYAIENTSTDTAFGIVFRLATTNSDRKIYAYLDNEKIADVLVPNTGDWQNWRSAAVNVSLDQGRHYLKLKAANDGFNINYFEIGSPVGIEQMDASEVVIGPNPANNVITVWSTDYRYHTLEIMDVAGNTVLRKSVAYTPEYHLPVDLPEGVYYLKISNDKNYQIKKISIMNP